jgi:hypothetical protein
MEQFSPEQLKAMRIESSELIALLRAEMEKGTPAESPEAVQLARRFKELADSFSAPDPEVDRVIERFYADNPDKEQHGMDVKLYRYIEHSKSFIR